MDLFGVKFPHLDPDGVYSRSLNRHGSWTGSFWTGMVLLAYQHTNNTKYIDYLESFIPLYRDRLDGQNLDHDLGFLYQLYAVALSRFSTRPELRALIFDASRHLLARYNPKGKFIRAWGRISDDYRRGKMIIDCMMNLPLLYNASRLTGDPRYREAAVGHADSTLRHIIRADHSTYHTFDFDPDTGLPLKGETEGGYADESAWSRGQAWGIYGFAQSFIHTGDAKYADAAMNLADFFIAHLPVDGVPYWDFKLPDFTDAVKDSSAAAIAASGMFDLSASLTDPDSSSRYREAAVQIVLSLAAGYSVASDSGTEALLRDCYVGVKEQKPRNACTTFGDYFYMESLMKATGEKTRMWTL